jgi:coproporphyrinogen III oxidase-like Fe-S oxidoreductase
MFGLPEQSPEQAISDVEQAIALAPTHLSLYQLTIEPNTLFHQTPPPLPDDDTVWAMQEALQARVAAAGYAQYEVSAYARAERECEHNRNYWRFGDYLGIGAGAHGKITDANGISRLWKVRQPKEYLEHAGTVAGIGGERRLSRADAAFEFMLNALRLRAGFETPLFGQRTGLPLSVVESPLRTAEARGLISWDLQRIVPTDLGARFLNDLVGLFLPDTGAAPAR